MKLIELHENYKKKLQQKKFTQKVYKKKITREKCSQQRKGFITLRFSCKLTIIQLNTNDIQKKLQKISSKLFIQLLMKLFNNCAHNKSVISTINLQYICNKSSTISTTSSQ